MNRDDNPYEILGLTTDDSDDAIKKAYRKLAMLHHPDKAKTEAEKELATLKFAKIADAYSLLQDPVRRYDWRMANESKPKSIPYRPAASTTSSMSTTFKADNLNRTNIGTSSTAHMHPKRTNPTTSSTMPVQKRASVQPHSVRVSPPHATRVAATFRESSVKSTSPLRSVRSSTKPSNTPALKTGQRSPFEGKLSTEHSKSMDSGLNRVARPVAGRKKVRSTKAPDTSIDGKPRNILRAQWEDFPKKNTSGRTSALLRESLGTRPGQTSRVMKSRAMPGSNLKRSISMNSMASLGGKSHVSTGGRSVATAGVRLSRQ